MVDITEFDDILNFHHRHLPSLAMVIGVHCLCKLTDSPDLDALVNRYGVDRKFIEDITKFVLHDGSLDQHLTGQTYQTLLGIQLAATQNL